MPLNMMTGVITLVTTVTLAVGLETPLTATQPAQAATLVEFTGGTGFDPFDLFPGQSLTTPQGNLPWNNLAFNWFALPETCVAGAIAPDACTLQSVAFGSLFLLEQEYLGTPNALGDGVPGFVAQTSQIANGRYVFDPQVVLQPNRQYFFYTDTSSLRLTGSPTSALPTEQFYFTRDSAENFVSTAPDIGFFGADGNFRLTGRPVPTPALLPGLVAMGIAAWRRRQQAE